MNRINEIGDTPRGQYMHGKLSQSYNETNLYTDDYDEVPEIADYASRNWRIDDNAIAFDLGKGDEANTKWVDDGNQRNFRKMHNLPQFENKQNSRMDMNKKLIRLTEGDLRRIVKQSVNKILKESSYDSMGNFNKELNNSDVREKLTDEITKISQEMSQSMSIIDGVAKRAVGDEEITKRARIVINALMGACREIRNVTQLINANRWDIPA